MCLTVGLDKVQLNLIKNYLVKSQITHKECRFIKIFVDVFKNSYQLLVIKNYIRISKVKFNY